MRPPKGYQCHVVSSEGGGFSFFKNVLKDGPALTSLGLPRCLRKKFPHELSSEVKVSFYTGTTFTAKYVAERKKLTGNEEISKYGGLTFGDVLIFTYHHCDKFELSVCCPAGVEKEFPLPNYRVDDYMAEEVAGFRIHVVKSYMLDFNPGVYIRRKYACAVKKFPLGGYITYVKDDREWKLKVAKKGKNVLIVDKAWVSFLHDLDVVCGQVIEFREKAEKYHYDVHCLPTNSH